MPMVSFLFFFFLFFFFIFFSFLFFSFLFFSLLFFSFLFFSFLFFNNFLIFFSALDNRVTRSTSAPSQKIPGISLASRSRQKRLGTGPQSNAPALIRSLFFTLFLFFFFFLFI